MSLLCSIPYLRPGARRSTLSECTDILDARQVRFIMDDGSEKKVSTGRGGRFLKLGGLTARVGSSYLGQRVKDAFQDGEDKAKSLAATHILNATRVVETFGQMKGAVMKLGQHMSLAADILPPEVVEILSKLQSTAPPVPFSQLRDQVIHELGSPPEELFAEFDTTAHASASIGQVHRATLHDGSQVVVKIQYPGVDRMVESDLDNLRTLAKTMGKVWFKGDPLKFFEEVRERLGEELDYRIERENLLLFRRLFADREDIVIPRPVEAFCSRRVLTMSYTPGMPWDEICCEDKDQGRRDDFGARLLDLLLCQFFDHGVMHADPHPGNFALDEKNRLVMYDFGCVKTFDSAFVEGYRRALRDAMQGHFDRIPTDLDAIGIRYRGRKPPSLQWYAEVAGMLLAPFLSDTPVPIHQADIHSQFQSWGRQNFTTLLQFEAPAELAMFNRVVAGMYGNLRRLKTTALWRDIITPYIAE